MSNNDLRYIKTEELIRNAFFACCSERTIEEIHIKDICAKARISRNAFYGHYENKYQLLEAVYKDVEKNMLEDLTPEIISSLSRDATYTVHEWCIRSVNRERDLLKILAKSSQPRFREMIHSVFIDGTLRAVFTNTELIDQDPSLRMSKMYIADGLVSIILAWLNEPEPIGEQELIDYLYDISHAAAAYFYRQLDSHPQISRR